MLEYVSVTCRIRHHDSRMFGILDHCSQCLTISNSFCQRKRILSTFANSSPATSRMCQVPSQWNRFLCLRCCITDLLVEDANYGRLVDRRPVVSYLPDCVSRVQKGRAMVLSAALNMTRYRLAIERAVSHRRQPSPNVFQETRTDSPSSVQRNTPSSQLNNHSIMCVIGLKFLSV